MGERISAVAGDYTIILLVELMPLTDIPVVDEPLFFLDYDGTLAPIVDEPMKAFPHPDVPDLLRTLEARYPLWIVTGRYLSDLTTFLDRPYRAIGLHGMQEGRIAGDVRELISDDAREALQQMRERVPDVAGLRLESKGPTFAVHYRHVQDEAATLRELESWLEQLPDFLDVIRGKKVYEIRPRNLTKGTAVSRLAAEHPNRTPVYLGDDVTDEDAFRALEELGRDVVTIKIGEDESAARFHLPGPDEVVTYLRRYAR